SLNQAASPAFRVVSASLLASVAAAESDRNLPNAHMTCRGVSKTRQYLSRKRPPGIYHGATIRDMLQAGRHARVRFMRPVSVSTGMPVAEARCPIPDSLPMNQPHSRT